MFTAKEKVALFDGIKTGIRNVWFSVIPVILTGINLTTGDFQINWKLIGAVALVAVITTIDSCMHEWGKLKENDTLEKGLSFGV